MRQIMSEISYCSVYDSISQTPEYTFSLDFWTEFWKKVDYLKINEDVDV